MGGCSKKDGITNRVPTPLTIPEKFWKITLLKNPKKRIKIVEFHSYIS